MLPVGRPQTPGQYAVRQKYWSQLLEVCGVLERGCTDSLHFAGKMIALPVPGGRSRRVRVTKLTDDEVTLDGNHRLVGEDLRFEIELVEIV